MERVKRLKALKKNIRICNVKCDMAVCCTDVKIYRGVSVLANPFFMANESLRTVVCNKYDAWLNKKVADKDEVVLKELNRLLELFIMYGALNLFCFCAPKRCHGLSVKKVVWKMYKQYLLDIAEEV